MPDWLEAFTRNLAETDYCRSRHHCCWCTSTATDRPIPVLGEQSQRPQGYTRSMMMMMSVSVIFIWDFFWVCRGRKLWFYC